MYFVFNNRQFYGYLLDEALDFIFLLKPTLILRRLRKLKAVEFNKLG